MSMFPHPSRRRRIRKLQPIEARFGKETTLRTDPLIPPFRTYTRDHLDYYLLLLRNPEN
ncbi:hypothetical protein [Streptomyces sp. MST-110588]|uniref:hypothetical protein n=1 Tax=Streptomyces sp. MST-110588 TaxID=2833628 RepID=UPI001F5D92BB|nr:hypothetical protein [Streptomyces sp. MST-110588]UNO38855.1 hypothetical protein KGS77_03335 [Streptomyces sp. MST-110588]